MTIYDVKFYGAYFPTKRGVCTVRMSQAMFTVDKGLPDDVKFEAEILRKFEGKKNVLKLKFKDNTVKYETLYEPGYCYENGSWKETTYREAPKAFFKEYSRLVSKARANKQTSIFEMTFYGVFEDVGLTSPLVEMSLSKAVQNQELGANGVLFTAKVLKEFKGNKYVVKLMSEETVEYISLFNHSVCYDTETGKWIQCLESPIPGKILKCYIKHLNE